MSNEIMASIVCTTYNHEKYISKTLDGFLLQKTNFPIEIIVHDDCSTDNTVNIIKNYQKKYPNRIQLIEQKENQGSKGKKIMEKIVIPLAKGKYIAICEGDDYWIDSNKLQLQVDYMEKNESCTCTYHAVNYVKDGKIVKNDILYKIDKDVSANQVIEGGGLFCATLSLVVRADIINKWPLFREMADVGDYPMQILFSLEGNVHYFPQLMGCYRLVSQGSWSQKMNNIREKRIKHYWNEKKWMDELNNYSNYKYSDSINFRIIQYSLINLYNENEIEFNEILLYLRKINSVYKKAKTLKIIIKPLIKISFKKNKIIYSIWKKIKRR